MPVDTRGFREEHVGKRLRVELADGEIDEINLLEVTICAEPEPCCGIMYRLLSSNRDGGKKNGEVYWTGFADVKNFVVLGE